jgi:hypothetical protein
VSSRLDTQVAAARVPVSPLHHLGTIGFVPARRLRQPRRSLTGALPKDIGRAPPLPRNALAGGSAPLDLIGHAAHRFDSARRLDPGVAVANGPGHLIVAAYELASKRISMLWMLSAFQILKVLPHLDTDWRKPALASHRSRYIVRLAAVHESRVDHHLHQDGQEARH